MKITDLIIDEEFEKVIPPLSDDEFELLEESILNDGEVYHPLIVWNNIIVDGHHRYKILKEHPEIKYRISEKSFDDRLEVISWICMNQLGRRNLTSAQKSVGYSPELLTDPKYFSRIQKAIQPVKDYFKNLEENRSIRVSETK